MPVDNRWTCLWMHFWAEKHRIVIVLASEYTLLSYLNVSSVFPGGKRHFLPCKCILRNHKSFFKGEPSSDFNRCYEQRILEKYNWILFIAVSFWFWSVAKYKRPIFKGFNCLYYWAGLNFVESRLHVILHPMYAGHLSILCTNDFCCVFRYYYGINANTDAE